MLTDLTRYHQKRKQLFGEYEIKDEKQELKYSRSQRQLKFALAGGVIFYLHVSRDVISGIGLRSLNDKLEADNYIYFVTN